MLGTLDLLMNSLILVEVESEVLATHSCILFVRARVDSDNSKLVVHEVLAMAAICNAIVDE